MASKNPIPLSSDYNQEDFFNQCLCNLIYSEEINLDYYIRLAQLDIAISRLRDYIKTVEDTQGGEA